MNSELKLTSTGISYLNQARKWTHFLAILGFIGTGIIVIVALFLSSILAMFSGMDSSYGVSDIGAIGTGTVTVFYLVLAIIYFFLSLYLYRFSIRIKAAVHEQNSTLLEDGLKNLKSYWKLTGVLTAVMLSIYFLFLLITLLFGAAFASM
ncbi:MAG: DUF5362 family protein [Flavobacteriaceae bacterium]|nr:DUF5362 family protein [Flavobacteriaceae bacterium]